jgi:hypothetical protein
MLFRNLALGLFCLAALPPAASAEVQLAIQNGRVTLVATDATVRQILTEWARVGQTRIVNVEQIPGGPLTLQLTGVAESEALDLLLRSVTGYMAATRSVPAPNLSRYDRILVLPTTAVTRVPVTTPPAPVFQQPFQRPVDPDSDEAPSIPPPRGPLFQTVPSAAPGLPPGIEEAAGPGNLPIGGESGNGQPLPTPFPGASTVGTPRPGMVMPAPQPEPGGQIDPPIPVEN